MKDKEAEKKVKELQMSKDRLIGDYIHLQDQADDLNQRIYGLCCEIETLNQKIELERKKAKKNGSIFGKQSNPPHSNGHQQNGRSRAV